MDWYCLGVPWKVILIRSFTLLVNHVKKVVFFKKKYRNATGNIYIGKSITINNQYKTNKSPLTYYSLEKEARNILRYTDPDKKTL